MYARAGDKFAETKYAQTNVSSTNGVVELAFSSDNSILAIGDYTGTVTLYNVPQPVIKKQGLSPLPVYYGEMELMAGPIDIGMPLQSLSIGPVSGNLVVGGGDQADGIIALYDAAADFDKIRNWTTTNVTLGVTFAPDESLVAASDNTGKVTLFNIDGTTNTTLTPIGTV